MTVELYGQARLLAGQKIVEVALPVRSSPADFAQRLADKYPALVGKAIRPDLSGPMDSYVLNLNGVEFISGASVELRQGDTLLLFSSQAGG